MSPAFLNTLHITRTWPWQHVLIFSNAFCLTLEILPCWTLPDPFHSIGPFKESLWAKGWRILVVQVREWSTSLISNLSCKNGQLARMVSLCQIHRRPARPWSIQSRHCSSSDPCPHQQPAHADFVGPHTGPFGTGSAWRCFSFALQ